MHCTPVSHLVDTSTLINIYRRHISSLQGGQEEDARGVGQAGEEGRSRRAWRQSLIFTLQTFPLGKQAPPSRAQRVTCSITAKKKNVPSLLHLPPPLIHCRHCMDWRSCYRQSHPQWLHQNPSAPPHSPRFTRQSCHCNNEESLTVIRQTILKDPDKFSCQKL